ncbi:hypothetical protein E2C01_060865 [Portunus trituberculatus]|uniref:Uncharacterized protein n=1 Tax=Portunus trituberculatus TaxID=210409 RepID=A0A5B7H997_PORTR|nr:hypothetical protein [Portunus trituberculatus]
MVDSHFPFPKTVNNGVPQDSVLSPTLFLLFINDLDRTSCPIHSYADDTTAHFSTSFQRPPTLQEVNRSRRDATKRQTSDLSKISYWGRENLVVFNASKIQFLHVSTRYNLPNNYPLFFSDTQLSPSSTLNMFSLSFTHNLNWKLHISSLVKTASMKLSVLRRLYQFFSPPQLLTLHI